MKQITKYGIFDKECGYFAITSSSYEIISRLYESYKSSRYYIKIVPQYETRRFVWNTIEKEIILILEKFDVELPFHGGCTYIHKYYNIDGMTSLKFGSDYKHLYDDRFKIYSTIEEASEVEYDSDRLFKILNNQEEYNNWYELKTKINCEK